MRVVIAELPVTDMDGYTWTVKLMGPSDSAAHPDRPPKVHPLESRITLELEPPDDPAHELYGTDPLCFPVAALSVALTPLAVRILTERHG